MGAARNIPTETGTASSSPRRWPAAPGDWRDGCSPAPMAWETRTVAPISMAERIEMMKKTISKPMPTPATAAPRGAPP